MVEIIGGAYGANGRLIRPAAGPFSLSVEEEKRLVNRDVARYVREYAEPDPPAPHPGESEESGGEETNPEGSPESESFSREELDDMTRDSLITVATQLGLKVNARMNKADILQAIHGSLNQADEPTPPDLTPEGPVL